MNGQCYSQLSLNFHPTVWRLNCCRTVSKLEGFRVAQWRMTLGCFSAVFSLAQA